MRSITRISFSRMAQSCSSFLLLLFLSSFLSHRGVRTHPRKQFNHIHTHTNHCLYHLNSPFPWMRSRDKKGPQQLGATDKHEVAWSDLLPLPPSLPPSIVFAYRTRHTAVHLMVSALQSIHFLILFLVFPSDGLVKHRRY